MFKGKSICKEEFDEYIQTGNIIDAAVLTKRSLHSSLCEILWRCIPKGKNGFVEICLQGHSPGSEIIKVDHFEVLLDFVTENANKLDCLSLVYSAALTRGLDRYVNVGLRVLEIDELTTWINMRL